MKKHREVGHAKRIRHQENHVSLHELDFEGQVLIWSLRMCLQGAKNQELVKDQFERALLPSAARLANQSVLNIIEIVKGFGKRSLRLNCLCRIDVSDDEKILLDFLKAVNNRDAQMVLRCANAFLNDDGHEKMIGAIGTFGISITIRKQSQTKGRMINNTFYHKSDAIH